MRFEVITAVALKSTVTPRIPVGVHWCFSGICWLLSSLHNVWGSRLPVYRLLHFINQ